jgi:hypothetical protein
MFLNLKVLNLVIESNLQDHFFISLITILTTKKYPFNLCNLIFIILFIDLIVLIIVLDLFFIC